MKKWLALVLSLLLCLVLCGCKYERQLHGRWEGMESLELYGPFLGATVLEFHEDGTAEFFAPGPESVVTVRYSCTDDTLTVTPMSGDGGIGIRYEVDGDTLTLGVEAVFHRVK